MRSDVMKPSQRYRAMANNRGRTGPELALASELWRRGIRYYTHGGYHSITRKHLIGRPDIVLSRKRILIFVDGCFWHGCTECGKHLQLSSAFWVRKIASNQRRDVRVTSELRAAGWNVIRIPEHSIRTKTALAETTAWLVPLIHEAPSRKENTGIGIDGDHQVRS